MCDIKLIMEDANEVPIMCKDLDVSIGYFTDYIKELDRLNLRLPVVCESVNFVEFCSLIFIDELRDYDMITFWKEKVLKNYLELFEKVTAIELNKKFIELNATIIRYIKTGYFILSFGVEEYYGEFAETLENLLIRKYLDVNSKIYFIRTDNVDNDNELYSYDVIINN